MHAVLTNERVHVCVRTWPWLARSRRAALWWVQLVLLIMIMQCASIALLSQLGAMVVTCNDLLILPWYDFLCLATGRHTMSAYRMLCRCHKRC